MGAHLYHLNFIWKNFEQNRRFFFRPSTIHHHHHHPSVTTSGPWGLEPRGWTSNGYILEETNNIPKRLEQCFFFGRETRFLSREKFSFFAREIESRPWKNRKKPSKVRVKITFCPWNFRKITRVKSKFTGVKNIENYTRETEKMPVKNMTRYLWNFSGNTYLKRGNWDNGAQ